MFRSKIDNTIVPQAEHQRLAGMIAALWGNELFEVPNIRRESYVKGVMFHDRGYGYFDNYGIGELDYPQWAQILRKGITEQFQDPIADLVVCLHIRRLLANNTARQDDLLLDEIDSMIDEFIEKNSFDKEEFMWADKITAISDSIAFDFSFREASTKTLPVFAKHGDNEPIQMTYSLSQDGIIHLDPWPLFLPEYTGYIYAYAAKGYSEDLVPIPLQYTLQAA